MLHITNNLYASFRKSNKTTLHIASFILKENLLFFKCHLRNAKLFINTNSIYNLANTIYK